VYFKYPSSPKWILEDISIEIKPGKFLGITGPVGSGKTSLVSLIPRLFNIQKGEIFIDNIPIKDLSLHYLRKNIGFVPQDSFLFSDTIANNIRFGKPDLSDDEIYKLIKIVALEEDLKEFPNGIHTIVGERGVTLSGGQKQRVSIARALANNPDILLSDEATSALDPKTTKSILELIKEIQQKFSLTVLMITHQMEVVKEICNKVAIMSDGRIVEQGGVHHIFAEPKNEITKELISYVHQQADTELNYLHHKGKKIIKVKFLGTSAQEPIISKVIKEYGIDISVLGGAIDKLATMNIGHLYLELEGNLNAQSKAIELMETMDVIVEVIYNGD